MCDCVFGCMCIVCLCVCDILDECVWVGEVLIQEGRCEYRK